MLMERIREVALRLRNGSLSVEELYKLCMQRAQSLQQLNAFVTLTPELAERQTKEASERIRQGKKKGKMAGIPIAVKGNYSTKGIQTTCASQMLMGYKPPYTATVVQRLFDEGAVMMGMTNLDEFAMGSGSVDSVHGPVQNVWRHPLLQACPEKRTLASQDGSAVVGGKSLSDEESDWFIAGGSSGGSAVAVASGMCFASLGSDTGGSVRIPASHCGVVGLKPTYGLCSRHGLIPLTNSMDVPGVFANTIDDAATVLGVIAGHDSQDSTSVTDTFEPFELPEDISVEGLNVGVPKEFHTPNLEPEVLQAWSRVADLFENAGAKVTAVSLPHTQYSILCYSVLGPVEIASNMARYDGIEYGHRHKGSETMEMLYAASRHEGFSDVVRGRILAGNYFLLKDNYEMYFLQAQKVRRLIAEDFRRVFEGGTDVLLTPTTTSAAKSYREFSLFGNRERQQQEDLMVMSANLAGIPAVSVPTILSSVGMPIGLQLIGQRFQDKQLLTVAKWMEREVKFPRAELTSSLEMLDS